MGEADRALAYSSSDFIKSKLFHGEPGSGFLISEMNARVEADASGFCHRERFLGENDCRNGIDFLEQELEVLKRTRGCLEELFGWQGCLPCFMSPASLWLSGKGCSMRRLVAEEMRLAYNGSHFLSPRLANRLRQTFAFHRSAARSLSELSYGRDGRTKNVGGEASGDKETAPSRLDGARKPIRQFWESNPAAGAMSSLPDRCLPWVCGVRYMLAIGAYRYADDFRGR